MIQQGRLFPGRERDTKEVEQYYQALQQIEKWTDEKQAITEDRIWKIHAIIYKERNVKPTPYRDGQNVIRDASGEIIYMPPEAEDVPVLMTDLVLWMHASEGVLPVPVIAGIAHYQFVTIHPFFDGNGRTARTLTTWILQRGGYALGKFYSLEEFYVEDLERYYKALITHPHHNYYFGRHEADITPWLSYFLNGMVIVFERVAEEVSRHLKAGKGTTTNVELLRPLDRRARRILSLFAEQETIQSCDVAALLGISTRQARVLLVQWVEQGWLVMTDASNKGRKCALEKKYIGLIKE